MTKIDWTKPVRYINPNYHHIKLTLMFADLPGACPVALLEENNDVRRVRFLTREGAEYRNAPPDIENIPERPAIAVGQKWRARNGDTVEIVHVKSNGPYPIWGIRNHTNGRRETIEFDEDGFAFLPFAGDDFDKLDLIELIE